MNSQNFTIDMPTIEESATILFPILCVRNAHPRDKNIKFEDISHIIKSFSISPSLRCRRKLLLVLLWLFGLIRYD